MKLTVEQYSDKVNKDRAKRGQLPLTDNAMREAYQAYIAERHYTQVLLASHVENKEEFEVEKLQFIESTEQYKSLWLCSIVFDDGTLGNLYGTFQTKEEAIKKCLQDDSVTSRIAQGINITKIYAEKLSGKVVSQNTGFDICYNEDADGELLGIYFNFQKFVNQELKDDLEVLVKKHFGKQLDIKVKL